MKRVEFEEDSESEEDTNNPDLASSNQSTLKKTVEESAKQEHVDTSLFSSKPSSLQEGEEDDDDDETDQVFIISDYSLSSRFEEFVSSLEKIILLLIQKVHKSNDDNFKEGVKFNGKEYLVRYVYNHQFFRNDEENMQKREKKVNSKKKKNTKTSSSSSLLSSANSYGDKKINVWQSMMNCENDFTKKEEITSLFGVNDFVYVFSNNNTISHESACMIMSALSVALNNLKIDKPFFVSVDHQGESNFIGRYNSSDRVIKFKTEKIAKISPMYIRINGLLDLFTLNLRETKTDLLLKNILITAKFTYLIESFKSLDWKKRIKKFREKVPDYLLQWGSICDPLEGLQISTTWDVMKERDLPAQDKLTPTIKNKWSIRYFMDSNSEVILVNYLKFFSQFYKEQKIRNKKKNKSQFNISLNLDREEDDSIAVTEGIEKIFTFESESGDEKKEDNFAKSFPLKSLLSLFVIQASYLDKLDQIELFWKKFILTLRKYWEKRDVIPNVEDKISWGDSLIYQKLVLLNICIKEINRITFKDKLIDNNESDSNESSSDESDFHSADEDDEDEFHDFDEDESFQEKEKKKEESDGSSRGEIKPEGVEGKLENQTISSTGEQINIPITRNPPPLTEDAIKLVPNTTSDYQTKSLFSDMEAFKAANPGCEFIDFCKWFSLVDVEKDENGKEVLSGRMQERSIWKDLWEEAEAIPVEKQKNNFDYYEEGEKVLLFLESLDFTQVVKEMMVHLDYIAYFTLNKVSILTKISNKKLEKNLSCLRKEIKKISKLGEIETETLINLNSKFEKIEIYLSLLISLGEKLEYSENMKQLIESLCLNGKTNVEKDEQKKIIMQILKKTDGEWISPEKREFVIRENSMVEDKIAHRLSVCFQLKRSFLLASAFSEKFPFN